MSSKFPAFVAVSVLAIGLAVAAPAAATAAPASCRTIPVDADPVLKSNLARDEYGVDGRGVKVGVVSNSYNRVSTLSTAEDNILDGLLPGPGNPCGYTQPVVVKDYPADPPAGASAVTDEGRAMVQLVHGIAPGAELFFASAGPDLSETQSAIDWLAEQGVDIILDDVILDGEPFYQQSVISTRIAELVDRGILYLSAAGNNTAVALGPKSGQEATPISGWETSAYRPADCDPTVPVPTTLPDGYTGYDCLDFDPGAGVATVSNFTTLPVNLGVEADGVTATLGLMMQWGEPFGGAKAKFEMIVTTNVAEPTTLEVDAAGLPVRFAEVPFDVTGKTDPTDAVADEVPMQVSIVRYTNDDPATQITPAIGFSSTSDGAPWAVNADWWRSQGPDTVGRTIIGHNGAPAAITVAATGAFDDDRVEYYSSIGPVRYYLTPEQTGGGGSLLAEPETHHKANILSVDGVRQNVIGGAAPPAGSPADTFLFQGTSAATPTAGGVAALALSLNPDLTPGEVRALLAQTATPIAAPYPTVPAEDSVGAGLINAQALLAEVYADLPPAPAGEPEQPPALAASGGGSILGLVIAAAALTLAGAGIAFFRRRGAASRG